MWDSTHQTRAHGEGWQLVTTFNNGDTHPLWDVVTFGARFRTDRDASLAVIDAAKRGGELHQRALKLVADSRLRPAMKSTRKRA